MDPSPIPKFDNPKLSKWPRIQLFGAGREQRIYALPPYTRVVSLDFEDHPFEATKADHACALCGAIDELPRRGHHRRRRRPDVRLFGHRLSAPPRARRGHSGRLCRRPPRIRASMTPLLEVSDLTKLLRRADRLPRGVVRSLARRGDGHRRRKRLGQDHAARPASPGISRPMPGRSSSTPAPGPEGHAGR